MVHEVEIQSQEKIKEFSFKQLKKTLQYIESYSPFYKRLFSENSIAIGSINSFDDLVKIPTTSKSDLQKYNDDFLCVPRSQIAEWTTTSGTLGTPVSFGLTKADLERLADNEARSLAITDCSSEDLIQLMVTLDKRFMAGLAYYIGAQKFGCSTIRVGSGSPGLQIDSIIRFKPSVIIAVPSFLLKVLEYAQLNNYKIADSTVKKIICIGEPIRNEHLELNNLGLRLRERWPEVKMFSTYASTEMATAITECASGCGGHIPPELIHIELLDETGIPVEKGSPGEVTVTCFGVEGMPLLRYRTGDICVMNEDPCDCGNNTSRLSPVLGRKKQMIKYKGTTLFPETVYELLNGLHWIKDYVVILENNELDIDELTVLISIDEQIESDKVNILLEEAFESHLRVKPAIEIKSAAEIRKIKFPGSSRKPLKLIDKRKNVLP